MDELTNKFITALISDVKNQSKIGNQKQRPAANRCKFTTTKLTGLYVCTQNRHVRRTEDVPSQQIMHAD